MSTTDRYKQSGDPARDLQLAIAKLDKFSSENKSEPIPNAHNLKVQSGSLIAKLSSPLEKTIDLARCFVKSALSDRAREKQEKKRDLIHEEVLRAIEVVKKNFLLIQKWKGGTPEQQKLAQSAMEAVHRYNETIAKTKRVPPTWSGRISRFLYQKSGLSIETNLQAIDLPQTASSHFAYKAKETGGKKIEKTTEKSHCYASTKKITGFLPRGLQSEEPISTQEADAFRVKAISLLRNHGIKFTSVPEEFSTIRSTPILASVHQDEKEQNLKRRVVMTQILTPLPGERIIFTGQFLRDSGRVTHSIPLSDSFEVTSNSHQTGFPHPSQYAGWALADCMIPPCPHRLDQMELFQPLQKAKQETAKQLLPQGNLNGKAKNLLKLKKEAFQDHKEELIALLQKLHQAIAQAFTALQAESVKIDIDHAESIFKTYFSAIQAIPASYDYHCGVQETLVNAFMTRPFEKLQEEWLERKTADLFAGDSKIRLEAARQILTSESEKALQDLAANTPTSELERATAAYITLIGTLLSKASHSIILQHLSEAMEFTPPMLNEFEQKVQTALYKQLYAFQDELAFETESKEIIYEIFKMQLETDRDLFSADNFDDLETGPAQLVNELEVYFNSRYYALSARKS